MASKKKTLKGIKSLEKIIKEHEQKLVEAPSEEGRAYLVKDIDRLRKQKEKKQKRL
ncbi:MAG TPA: hypothetical protein VI977_02615 [archaeon]|nr:hypothetical protein [archaeon]